MSQFEALEAQRRVKVSVASDDAHARLARADSIGERVRYQDPATKDAELVERAFSGERWARAALYQRHVADVTNLALRLLRDRDQAADVAQDTFVTALETLGDLREPARVRPWLRAIAVRHVQRRFRRRRLLRALGIGPPPGSISLAELASRAADQDAIVQLRRVDSVLATLRERARIVWTLRIIEGEGLAEIAETCGISLATVKRDLALAEARVRAVLDEEEGP